MEMTRMAHCMYSHPKLTELKTSVDCKWQCKAQRLTKGVHIRWGHGIDLSIQLPGVKYKCSIHSTASHQRCIHQRELWRRSQHSAALTPSGRWACQRSPPGSPAAPGAFWEGPLHADAALGSPPAAASAAAAAEQLLAPVHNMHAACESYSEHKHARGI